MIDSPDEAYALLESLGASPRLIRHLRLVGEAAGEALLLEHGVRPDVARCCVSHARHDAMPVVYEELLVALADKLWKGERDGSLERRVVAETAARLGRAQWGAFAELDAGFEAIAAGGDDRLRRSVP